MDNIAEQMKDCGLKIKKGQIYVPQEDFILPGIRCFCINLVLTNSHILGKDTLRKHSQLLASVVRIAFEIPLLMGL